MSYLVLARKYRPKTFEEVAGQDVVTRTLRGAISEGRVGHAYLLCGPRGTGKTTSARLFAKALNCEKGPTPIPCGECERCLAADRGNEVDLVEIDAASNTGVDHVRELRDQTAYVPLRARFKVYIVDEVHMLSKAAFNALLKTLEEPPPHVKFLLATTEPHKVPDTILSRCQVLRLVPLDEETIRARLDEVFRLEGIDAEDGVSAELARRARGGMRDALSLADQLLALVGSKPSRADLDRLSSETSTAVIEALVDALVRGQRLELLEALPAVEGGESELLSGLLDYLRGCLVVGLCGPEAPMLTAADELKRTMHERAKAIGARRLELWLQELLAARERMRLLPAHGRTVLEVTLLELCEQETALELSEIARRLLALEARLAGDAPAAPAPAPARPPAPVPARLPEDDAPPASRTARTSSHADTWAAFLDRLAEKKPALSEIVARRGELVRRAEGRAVVKLTGLRDEERLLLDDARNQRSLSAAFSAAAGTEVELEVQDAARARPGREDGFTRKVADLFDGRIEE